MNNNTAYISNTCAIIEIYKTLNIEYNHPFIGSLFIIDEQYIKFCNNFDYYINCDPLIGQPNNNSLWTLENKGIWYKHKLVPIPYVVMYLDDIEIHWIHETNQQLLLEKYQRRLGRYKQQVNKVFFILSCSEFINKHTETQRLDLLTQFLSNKNNIYISRCPSDLNLNNTNQIILNNDWINTSNKRDSSHIYIFNNQITIAHKALQHIVSNNL